MISLFSNDESPDSVQAIPGPAAKPAAPQATSQPAYSTAQHPAVSKTVVAPAAPAPEKHGLFSWLSIGKAKKRLQMLETVSLGEKRFVALVQVDGRQFLIGGAPSNVGMIAELAPEETFQQVLRDATQGGSELPAPQAVEAVPVQAAPIAPPPIAPPTPIVPLAAAPVSQPESIEPEIEATEAEEAVLHYPQPPAFGSTHAPVHHPVETPEQPAVSAQTAPAPLKAPIPFPVSTQPVEPAPIVVAAAPALPEPSPVVAENPTPVTQGATQPPAAPVTPTPTHHISVAPFALAEAVVPAGATFSPVPAPVKPSLPPHVAARLAELQAAAELEASQQTTQEQAIFPEDLSLEEPISFSPSLLAAMQQRARAALLKDLASTIAAQQEPVQQAAPETPESVAQKMPPASVLAPSFTFQFSPMLSSTTQAIRMPSNPNAKLQGAA